MSLCIEVCTTIAEVFLAAYLFERLFTRKHPAYIACIYYTLYGLVIILSTYFISAVILRIFALLLCSFIGNWIVYSGSLLPHIYITALYYISVLLSDLIGGAALSLHSISMDIELGGSERLLYNLLAKLINLLLVQLLILIFYRNKGRALPYTGIPLLLCQIFSAIVCYACFIALIDGDASNAFLLTGLCLLIMNMVICVFVHLLQRYYEARTEAIAAEKQREVQLQYYQDMLAHQEETRALWHDIKKYFSAMEAMIEANHSSEAKACFGELKSKFDQINHSVDVGNRIINSILSRAVKQAVEINTKLELDVRISPELSIPPADLFIIIGNTLDNALEACAQLPVETRTIHIILHQHNQLLYYEASNPCAQQQKTKQGSIHGYGLKNVKQCVEKNGGTMETVIENGTYTVKIILNV